MRSTRRSSARRSPDARRASQHLTVVTDEPTREVPAVEFLLRFTRAGHEAGYPTAELEARALALARALGLREAQVSATPTLVDVSLGSLPRQRTYTLRVRPQAVDLDAVSRLDRLGEDVLAGRLNANAALDELSSIRANPLRRSLPVLLGAYSAAGAALTPVLGGGWWEAGAAAVAGLLVGAVAVPGNRAVRAGPIVAPVAAVAASFCAAALAWLGVPAAPDVVTLAALVTLLPGMSLTIGMRELATEHLQSGVANTARALVQLLGLVFGVGIGTSVAANWFGSATEVAPDTAFSAMYLVAAVAAGLAFTLTLSARFRDAYLMCGATLLAVGASEVGKQLFGVEAAVFVAALSVGVAGGLAGGLLHRSPLVFIVPGVLMLAPGSAAYDSALQLLANETITGIRAGFETFVTAISIAYGLVVSALIVPRRLARGHP